VIALVKLVGGDDLLAQVDENKLGEDTIELHMPILTAVIPTGEVPMVPYLALAEEDDMVLRESQIVGIFTAKEGIANHYREQFLGEKTIATPPKKKLVL
jgi:hypothetical protein